MAERHCKCCGRIVAASPVRASTKPIKCGGCRRGKRPRDRSGQYARMTVEQRRAQNRRISGWRKAHQYWMQPGEREKRTAWKRSARERKAAAEGRTLGRASVPRSWDQVQDALALANAKQAWRWWLKNAPDAWVRAYQNARKRHLYATSPRYALYVRLKRWMHKHLRAGVRGRGSRKWAEVVGYSPAELHAHLESQFSAGMGWHNMGVWHIDHIRPVASFDFATVSDTEFLECFALSNLQPLWARDNLSKSDLIDGKRSRVLGGRSTRVAKGAPNIASSGAP